MPELPEVETVRQSLAPVVIDRVISQVNIYHPDVLIIDDLPCTDWQIESLDRRGKYLIFELLYRAAAPDVPERAVMLVHLRMTGRLLLQKTEIPPARHTHIRFMLSQRVCQNRPAVDSGPNYPEETFWLDFQDTRRFGRIWLLKKDQNGQPQNGPSGFYQLGPEPLGPDFDAASLSKLLQRRQRSSIKAALLDQSVIAGLGNIYADETLFAAGIKPTRNVAGLNAREVQSIAQAVCQVLKKAVDCQGTSLRDYVDGWNQQGRFQECLMVYGRAGLACRICGSSISKIKLAGRTTSFCPSCQS